MTAAQSYPINILEATPVITTGIYASGDLIGALIELTNAVTDPGRGGVIEAVSLTDLGNQSDNIDVIFFDTEPTATTFTDNAALDINDADLLNLIGFEQITSYAAFADNSLGRGEADRKMPFAIPGGTSLWAALVSRATPTYVSVADLTLRVAVRQE